MNEVKFLIDAERMTFDDLIAMTEGSLTDKRNTMARFVVNVDGEYVSDEEGRRSIGKLRLAQVRHVIARFVTEFSQINPQSGAA